MADDWGELDRRINETRSLVNQLLERHKGIQEQVTRFASRLHDVERTAESKPTMTRWEHLREAFRP